MVYLFLGAFAALVGTNTVNGGLVYVLCLFPYLAGPLGIYRFVELELAGHGLQGGQLLDGSPPLLAIWAYLLLDIFLWLFVSVRLARRAPPSAKFKDEAHMPLLSPDAFESTTPRGGDSHEAVKIKQLGRSFAPQKKGAKPVYALSGLDLTLREGQISCLLGQNGAGKTTTISILTGLLPPSTGSATVYGHSVTTLAGMDAIRALSGVCPQHDIIFLSLTGQMPFLSPPHPQLHTSLQPLHIHRERRGDVSSSPHACLLFPTLHACVVVAMMMRCGSFGES